MGRKTLDPVSTGVTRGTAIKVTLRMRFGRGLNKCSFYAGPNGTYCLRPLEHWDHGFESHLRHGCVSAIFCVVLPCV
jgi:hypothetical protein